MNLTLLLNYTNKYSDFKSRHKKSNLKEVIVQLLVALYRIAIARYYLRNCTKVGNYVSVNQKPKIVNKGEILLADDVRIWSSIVKSQIYVSKGGILEVGENSRLNGVHLDVKHNVTIGRNVRIAPGTLIMDSDFHSVEDHFSEGKILPVIIEDNVWIASRSIILKGVTIGKGSVVAAGSVVTKNVEPYTVVAGVPAKLIKRISINEMEFDGFNPGLEALEVSSKLEYN